ncbi:hypothetical protein [Lentzea sp. E54]|uniref:hypothetical protein n=1 Tax=Lentzea xerophila TaxID=3435883 RepID=UPI003DA28DED
MGDGRAVLCGLAWTVALCGGGWPGGWGRPQCDQRAARTVALGGAGGRAAKNSHTTIDPDGQAADDGRTVICTRQDGPHRPLTYD